ncbi:MAG: carboxypeptidase regulatory-like domain-containing protein [Acidobacteria bacterium]|nr:carboxypeptidase regulatory-like domain-containing protein [Acidobacteriota bacterium]
MSPFRHCLVFAATLTLVSSALSQTPTRDNRPRTASISGRVTISGKPAVNATVTVIEDDPKLQVGRIASQAGQEFVDQHYYRSKTDSEGNYQITDLPAGRFRVSALSRAFIPANKFLGGDAFKHITVDEAENREKVDFELVRGGVITGRVTDEEGRPQIGKYVRLSEVVGPGERREVSRDRYTRLETDDRGIYRIYGLRAGQYIVYAGGEYDTVGYFNRDKPYEVTYHPDVINQEQAKVIEVSEGGEVTDVDIKLIKVAVLKKFEALGRVIDSETGKSLPNVKVYCMYVENAEQEIGNSAGVVTTDGEGKFILASLKPGKYRVKLLSYHEDTIYYSDGKFFVIDDGDVGGLEVIARRGATINGVVAIEGNETSVQASLSQISVSTRVHKEHLVGNVRFNSPMGWFNSKIGPDGVFQVIGAPPGKATFSISGTSSNEGFLLGIERNGVDVKDGLEIGPGEKITGVRIVVGYGTGVIRGSVKVIGGTLPEGWTLSVQANRERAHQGGRAAQVNEKGQFVIEGLLTGVYDLFIYWSTKHNYPAGQGPKMSRPPTARVSVSNGAETQVTLTWDLSRNDQEKQ